MISITVRDSVSELRADYGVDSEAASKPLFPVHLCVEYICGLKQLRG